MHQYTNLTGEVNDKGFKYLKKPTEINFKENPLYISQNCIRHHLFRDQAFDLHDAKEKNLQMVLSSITGLIRGYVVAASQCKRTSPLLLEDFVDGLGNGNYEQFNRAKNHNRYGDGGIESDNWRSTKTLSITSRSELLF